MKEQDEKKIVADIVIAGGGPAGLSAALLLGRAGFKVILLTTGTLAQEPASSEQFLGFKAGRTAALFASSVTLLKQCGVWNDLKDLATPLEQMQIIDSNPLGLYACESLCLSFSAEENLSHVSDPIGYNVSTRLLQEIFESRIKKHKKIICLEEEKMLSCQCELNKIRVETEQGKTLYANILIGADGKTSTVRKNARIATKTYDYDQTAITCVISHEKDHGNISTEFHRTGGPFTLVPMTKNHSAVVWVEKTEDAKQYLSMKKDLFEQAIQDRTEGTVGLIRLASSVQSWPLSFLLADDLIAPRIALVAESAHVLSPIGAQGLNLSFRDVSSLVETLIESATIGEDIGSSFVLERYKKRRWADIQTRANLIHKYNRLVSSKKSLAQDIRRITIKIVKNQPVFKKALFRHAFLFPKNKRPKG